MLLPLRAAAPLFHYLHYLSHHESVGLTTDMSAANAVAFDMLWPRECRDLVNEGLCSFG